MLQNLQKAIRKVNLVGKDDTQKSAVILYARNWNLKNIFIIASLQNEILRDKYHKEVQGL